MKNSSQYLRPINGFYRKRILVLGDLMLDVYLKGSSTRLCPEAPVPVVNIAERIVLPGGAANTVCNLRALGATVFFCTVIGNDPEGDEAVNLLGKIGIDTQAIVRDPDRRTITKSRVMAGTQVITRIDQGSEGPISEEATKEIMSHVETYFQQCDAVVISDYGKGVINDSIILSIRTLLNREKKFTAVDSKRLDYFSEIHPSYAKPNYDEVIKLLQLAPRPTDRQAQVAHHAQDLYQKTNSSLITATLDAEGSVVIENGSVVQICSSPSVTTPHVAGAGDTYLSAFVLAFLNSRNSAISAEIATAAAAIAIRKEGTSTCSQAELKSYFNIHSKFIADLADLRDICDAYHGTGKRIVFTNGCFDILHSGHVTYLHRARQLGDILIVGLNNDASIKRLKGESRPINALVDRLQVLAGLSAVDHIIPFGQADDDTPVPLIKVVRPDVFAKGGDYTKEELPEAQTVESFGGKIVFLDHIPDHSTTRIISRINAVSQTVHEPLPNLRS